MKFFEWPLTVAVVGPSLPLSDSNLIQTIIDARILEVLRARIICHNFENAWIKIVKLDGGLLTSLHPSDLIHWRRSSDSMGKT